MVWKKGCGRSWGVGVGVGLCGFKCDNNMQIAGNAKVQTLEQMALSAITWPRLPPQLLLFTLIPHTQSHTILSTHTLLKLSFV